MTAFPRHNWAIDAIQPVNRLCSLNRGLVAWWLGIPGWTGGRRFIDITSPGPNGNHGTLTNMDIGTAWAALPWGGRAINPDGSDDYVQLTVTPTPFSAAHTLSFWLEWDGSAALGLFSAKGTNYSNAEHWGLLTSLSDGGVLKVHTGSGYGGDVATGLSAGDTAHIVSVHDGGINWTFFVNGVEKGTSTQTKYVTNDGNARLATGGFGTTNYPRPMGDLRVWSRILANGEIKAVYHDSLQGYPLTLKRVSQPVIPAAAAAGNAMPMAIHHYQMAGGL